MVRTVKLSYTTVPQAVEIIAQWRKAQSVVIRTAYNRVREGKKDKEILDLLRCLIEEGRKKQENRNLSVLKLAFQNIGSLVTVAQELSTHWDKLKSLFEVALR